MMVVMSAMVRGTEIRYICYRDQNTKVDRKNTGKEMRERRGSLKTSRKVQERMLRQ